MEFLDLTFGTDPELFIINSETGKVVSAVGLIPGTKDEPYPIKELGDGFALQTDNILVEFNVPPSTYSVDLVTHILKAKDYIKDYVKRINSKYDIMCAASAVVDLDQLQSKEAKQFGCDKDYNVYTQEVNPKPENANRIRTRSAGLHLHIGYRNPNTNQSLELVKYLDMYIGIPSLLYDTDKKRRSLYGKAGCFRLCSYGFEYRTLSGALLKDIKTLDFVQRQMMKAIYACEARNILIDPITVQKCINNSDIKLAKTLINEYNLLCAG